MITLRVYDSASVRKKFTSYVNRYCLYFPTPRNKVREWGFLGCFLRFSFGEDCIIRCGWDTCLYGVKSMALGKRVKREQLPKHVQNWIKQTEDAYNKAVTEDSEEAWRIFYERALHY